MCLDHSPDFTSNSNFQLTADPGRHQCRLKTLESCHHMRKPNGVPGSQQLAVASMWGVQQQTEESLYQSLPLSLSLYLSAVQNDELQSFAKLPRLSSVHFQR